MNSNYLCERLSIIPSCYDLPRRFMRVWNCRRSVSISVLNALSSPPSLHVSSSVVDWLSTLWEDTNSTSSSSNHPVVMVICDTQMSQSHTVAQFHFITSPLASDDGAVWQCTSFLLPLKNVIHNTFSVSIISLSCSKPRYLCSLPMKMFICNIMLHE